MPIIVTNRQAPIVPKDSNFTDSNNDVNTYPKNVNINKYISSSKYKLNDLDRVYVHYNKDTGLNEATENKLRSDEDGEN